MSALRSCLSQAHRNVTAWCLPLALVEGAAPAGGEGGFGGEAAAGVADLDQQLGGADGARAGQRLEDRRVGVLRELLGDEVVEPVDLLADVDKRGADVGLGGVRGRVAGVTAQARRG